MQMRPARRQRRLVSKKAGKKSRVPLWFRYVLFPLIIIFPLLFILFSSKDWNGKDRFVFAYPLESGDVEVSILDPELSEFTTLIIPGDTQVDVASNYGVLRLKNVWQLGINEKKYGDLLTKTITKNFLLPHHLWSDTDGASLRKSNPISLIKFVLLPKKTNIAIGDRFRIAIFVFKIKNIDKFEIDLAKNQFVKKANLIDGESGFVTGEAVSRLTVYFSDSNFYGDTGALRVYLIDKTGEFGPAQKMGEILEVLGGKVISIDKSSDVADLGCEVRGQNKAALNKIGKIFDCNIVKDQTDYDIELTIGKKFVQEF